MSSLLDVRCIFFCKRTRKELILSKISQWGLCQWNLWRNSVDVRNPFYLHFPNRYRCEILQVTVISTEIYTITSNQILSIYFTKSRSRSRFLVNPTYNLTRTVDNTSSWSPSTELEQQPINGKNLPVSPTSPTSDRVTWRYSLPTSFRHCTPLVYVYLTSPTHVLVRVSPGDSLFGLLV